MKSVEWAFLPLDRIDSGAAAGAAVMVETISSPFWVGTYVGVEASIPVGMVLGIDDGIDDTVGTAVTVGASVGTYDTVGALEAVGVAVEGWNIRQEANKHSKAMPTHELSKINSTPSMHDSHR